MLLIKYKKTYLYKEMVYIKINDKDIPSFSEETIDEFRNRVAVKFKTLPSLMSVIKEGKVFFIENLVKETKLKSFSEFLKYIKDTYDFPRVLDIELILYTWILSNKEGDSEEFIGYKRLEDEIKQSVFLRNSLQDFDFLKFQDEKFKNEMKKKIKERKEELKKNVDKVDEIYKIL